MKGLGVIPTTFLAALREEARRAFAAPYQVPGTLACNGALMVAAWFLLPGDWLFSVHTSRIFPLTLAVWMLADVPATNVLGSDAERMSVVLDRPEDLRRMLGAKHVVLWLLVVPVCMLVAVLVGLDTGQTGLSVLATIAALVIVPFGVLAIAGWLGILWPYHAMPLTQRWQHRRPLGRMVLRWASLLLIPYGLVPFLGALFVAPVLLGGRIGHGSWATGSDAAFVGGVLIVTSLAVTGWVGGHAVGTRIAGRRCAALRDFLADPLRG